MSLLGEIIACVYENQEVDAYLLMAVPYMLRQIAVRNLAAARAESARHSRAAAALGGALVAAALRNPGSGAAPGRARRPRPLLLGRGRSALSPGALRRGRGREVQEVREAGAGWLREGDVGEGRRGQGWEVQVFVSRREREVGEVWEGGEVRERGKVRGGEVWEGGEVRERGEVWGREALVL